jgi:hypothetical protein
MEALSEILAHMTGAPAVIGLVLTALIVFLTSDWRLSLTALLVQYILIGMVLTSSIRVEVAIVKTLVGVLAVSILYLTARHIQERKGSLGAELGGRRFLGIQLGWAAGPLGLPLRLLTILLVVVAVVRAFNNYQLPLVPADTAFVAVWLGAMGMVGLILSSDALRVAPALLTILGGFDLVYSGLEPSLAVVGLWSTLILSTALAFAYLATVQDLATSPTQLDTEIPAISAAELGPRIEDRAEPTSPRERTSAELGDWEAEP